MRTNLYTVLCVAIRFGAVLLAIGMCEQLVPYFFVPLLSDKPVGIFLVGYLVIFVIGIGVALLLWLRPGILARLATNPARQEVLESPIEAAQIQHIVLATLGVWLLIKGFAGLVASAVTLWRMQDVTAQYPTFSLPPQYWQTSIEFAVQTFGGLWLAFGAYGLTGMLQRYRGYGLPPANADEDAVPPRQG